MRPGWGFDERSIGALLVAAGRYDEAIPWLTVPVDHCYDFDPPVHAYLFLGNAYAGKHDTAKACEAYAHVLSIWPHPIPRSVTVDEARARSKELGCPPP